MTQDKINKAVKECVRESLGAGDPLETLLACIDKLRQEGKPAAELDIIRTTCIRMLSVVYDTRGLEAEDQTHRPKFE
jgi:hypothetical protein